jgi:malate dehydrogenase
MVEAIALDQNRILPCAAYVNGEYGLSEMFIGVPVKLGKGGIKEKVKIDLNAEELALLHASAKNIENQLTELKRILGW